MNKHIIPCYRCSKEVEQKEDGSGGFEIIFSRWFNDIKLYRVYAIVCNDCFNEIANLVGIDKSNSQFDIDEKEETAEEMFDALIDTEKEIN